MGLSIFSRKIERGLKMTIHHHLQARNTPPIVIPEDILATFDHYAAHREGWALSDCGVYSDGSRRIELQKIDNPSSGSAVFREDREAWLHVVHCARGGSFLHARALELIDRREKLAIEAHCGSW
jgi:hypothetical protein